MSGGYLLMRGRVLFSPGGPLGIDKVHSQLVTSLCNRKRERNQRGRVHREIHDAATETMCSPGQHNEALSRTTWFECTSDRKGERCTAPYASTHHIIFPQPWMRPSHRQPPLLSDSQSQNLSQHVFYTMQRKSLGFAPSRTLGEDRLCLQAARAYKASERERKGDGLLFSEIWRAMSYYPQSFMWSQALFIPCLQNCLLQNWFYFCFFQLLLCLEVHSKTAVGLTMMKIDTCISLVMLNWNGQHQLRQHYVNMTAIIQA